VKTPFPNFSCIAQTGPVTYRRDEKESKYILTLPRRVPSSIIDKYLWLVKPKIINKLVPTEWNSRLPVEKKVVIGN